MLYSYTYLHNTSYPTAMNVTPRRAFYVKHHERPLLGTRPTSAPTICQTEERHRKGGSSMVCVHYRCNVTTIQLKWTWGVLRWTWGVLDCFLIQPFSHVPVTPFTPFTLSTGVNGVNDMELVVGGWGVPPV